MFTTINQSISTRKATPPGFPDGRLALTAGSFNNPTARATCTWTHFFESLISKYYQTPVVLYAYLVFIIWFKMIKTIMCIYIIWYYTCIYIYTCMVTPIYWEINSYLWNAKGIPWIFDIQTYRDRGYAGICPENGDIRYTHIYILTVYIYICFVYIYMFVYIYICLSIYIYICFVYI